MTNNDEAHLSVALAHPHILIREGLASLLKEAGFTVAAQADSLQALRGMISREPPDIVLLDWELPDVNSEGVKDLVDRTPNAAIVIVTRPQSPEAFSDIMQSGVSGYLSVNLPPDEFVQSLHILNKGHMVVSREMAEHLGEGLGSEAVSKPEDVLTSRERDVLGMVALGATNKEIAENLIITENTVKVHLRRLLDKLDLRNRQQAAAYAVQEGLVGDVSIELASAPTEEASEPTT